MSVKVHLDGDIAQVVIDNPPVNALSQSVRDGLLRAVGEIEASNAKVAILSCKGRTFVAGADVREFGAPPVAPHLPDVLNAIESSGVPWVAAIHGTALGGGLELCLACAYRVATRAAKMGLPEVSLGLIPGAGGTVRLPRLIAPVEALKMISGGRAISANVADELSLIDAVVTDIDAGAREFATGIVDQPRPMRLSDRKPEKPSQEFHDAAAKIKKRAKGQNAITAAVDTVESALTASFSDALAQERATFLGLKNDPQSMALRHIFFAERSVGKLPSLKNIAPMVFEKVGVVGGGTMGSGIAAACLLKRSFGHDDRAR